MRRRAKKLTLKVKVLSTAGARTDRVFTGCTVGITKQALACTRVHVARTALQHALLVHETEVLTAFVATVPAVDLLAAFTIGSAEVALAVVQIVPIGAAGDTLHVTWTCKCRSMEDKK